MVETSPPRHSPSIDGEPLGAAHMASAPRRAQKHAPHMLHPPVAPSQPSTVAPRAISPSVYNGPLTGPANGPLQYMHGPTVAPLPMPPPLSAHHVARLAQPSSAASTPSAVAPLSRLDSNRLRAVSSCCVDLSRWLTAPVFHSCGWVLEEQDSNSERAAEGVSGWWASCHSTDSGACLHGQLCL
jgi:hypothetical protein